jgi:hypothetical protein
MRSAILLIKWEFIAWFSGQKKLLGHFVSLLKVKGTIAKAYSP